MESIDQSGWKQTAVLFVSAITPWSIREFNSSSGEQWKERRPRIYWDDNGVVSWYDGQQRSATRAGSPFLAQEEPFVLSTDAPSPFLLYPRNTDVLGWVTTPVVP